METLSLPAARRIALAAQGFAEPRPSAVRDWRPIGRALGRLGLLQIDSVNVLARAHYLPLYSRLGAYPRQSLEAAAWGKPRRLFEYWAHEASLLPLELQPLLRWRMARAERGEAGWPSMKAFAVERRAEAEALLKQIGDRGPLAASDLDAPKGQGGWWGWSESKAALEFLFIAGRITTANRRGSFERVYDLTERVLPARILDLPTPAENEAHGRLLALSAAALGVATASDLRDYFRLPDQHLKAELDRLVEAGELVPARVEGWRQTAYLHRDARRPRSVQTRALLAPFDPLVWERSRTERLFGMRYRIEIYTPAEKRTHGYYVLPFLLGETLAARVDLKADRPGRALLVQSAHAEPGAPGHTAEALAQELHLMAGWLGLGEVKIAGGGDLSAALAQAL